MERERFEGGCSTIVIGKAVSETGRVMVGHNEDDDHSIIQMHAVPRIHHEEGETISFADGSAVIPQVPVTWAHYWTEVRHKDGASFGDSYFNEWGVAIVTNSSNPGKQNDEDIKKCGLGYAVRQILAERATSAKHGLEILIELVEKYGYISSRSYQIADKDECWVCELTRSNKLVAKRVPDDHIYFMPNWYTIQQLEPSDKENFYYTPDLVEYAIAQGWYTPAKEGDYSDFNFAKVYFSDAPKESCVVRDRNAWPVLGFEEKKWKRFSEKAERIYGKDDIKNLLRNHWEGREDANNVDYNRDPHQKNNDPFTICCSATVESTIFEFNEDAASSIMWRAWLQPCTNPYVPFYLGAIKAPKNYAWMDYEEAKATHFAPPAEEFEYNPATAYWIFRNLIWMTQLDYGFCHKILAPEIAALESKWEGEKAEILAEYNRIKAEDAELAKEYLSTYSLGKAAFALRWAMEMTQKVGMAKHWANEEQ
ncbi:MAG: C69 family dipeptidase [Clostridia bacterium]|nr:C69 family dipeptidase [Clostridia bacterium]